MVKREAEYVSDGVVLFLQSMELQKRKFLSSWSHQSDYTIVTETMSII